MGTAGKASRKRPLAQQELAGSPGGRKSEGAVQISEVPSASASPAHQKRRSSASEDVGPSEEGQVRPSALQRRLRPESTLQHPFLHCKNLG